MQDHPKPGVTALRQSLGVEGVIDLDPLTATPRTVAKLDGFLTGPSAVSPAKTTSTYVAEHPDVFSLTPADLATLKLRQDYVDIVGTHHLSWVQFAGAIPVFDNGLKAAVAKDGSLINVQGSPLTDLHSVGNVTALGAAQARSKALADVGGKTGRVQAGLADGPERATEFSDASRASLVLFQTVSGLRLAWQTLISGTGGDMFTHVIDATTGRVLYRRSLTQSDNANVWEYWPGAARGGKQVSVNLTAFGWLPNNSPRLAGNTAHVFTDVNDDNVAQPAEEVTPVSHSFAFPFVNFNAAAGSGCSARFPCSWDSSVPYSWQINRKQDAVQVFYYVSKYHDHLRSAPIGFTRSAGNFEAVDGDAVQAQPDDGADTAGGLPDSYHIDNANMTTFPDGMPPIMQMYLFHDPTDPTDPFLQANGGDEADVVYHEYTHGLSNRLVVDAAGNSTLGLVQAGSMGEAWSDWYAMDYLNDLGYQRDTSAPGEVRIGNYTEVGQNLLRTQPMDCPVGSTSAKCPGTAATGPGGYTYGDFGKIAGQPEVHADGEIWAETLWDLRTALGSRATESLVTRAMELSPANPSFMDERNAILQADTVVDRGRNRTTIWKVFAHRGMGYFAGSIDGDDTAPAEDFTLPPRPGGPTGQLTGTVTDSATGAVISGATVDFGGHASGFPGDYSATTDAAGHYTISGVFAGNYPKVWVGTAGYDRSIRTVPIARRTNVLDWELRRDWAALSGGAAVTSTSDDAGAPFGCGTAQLFDQSQSQGWSAYRTVTAVGSIVPVIVVVKLPRAVDISQVAIDPSANCGDDGSASTGPYSLESSTDGITYRPMADGTFSADDQGRFSTPALTSASTGAVRFLRYTMKDSQVSQVGNCPGPFAGCAYIDSSELEVYGTPPAS